MTFTPTPLTGSYMVDLAPFSDDRGWFARYFCKKEFAQIGHEAEWVQMNHSMNVRKGTLRGMHYQVAPHAEIKLVRCITGSIRDVIIDLRAGSPTLLRWFATELSASNKKMLYIPAGFAHGFQCLEDHCEVLYHHTAYYEPSVERGIRYDDPLVGIEWTLPAEALSARDAEHPYLEKTFKGI